MPHILIADDHDLVRETIAAYLDSTPDLSTVTAATLQDALETLAGNSAIDLVILDYSMPGMNGLAGLDAALEVRPRAKIALMSGIAPSKVAQEAMSRGACGFFPKSLAAESMVNAIRFVLSGEKFFPFGFAADSPQDRPVAPYRGLTPRELQTLEYLCQGKSNKEIARALHLKEVTIKLHVKNILQKLDVGNRTQAALLARQDGFIAPVLP